MQLQTSRFVRHINYGKHFSWGLFILTVKYYDEEYFWHLQEATRKTFWLF